ncbi:DUF2059 domain-containing protein [Maritalea sp.]|uniref:DUF2059 domain-containing protein n=1 Tax=Maritalea sp. TaxID=2003361 RepID=UPI003EF7C016
MRLLFGFLILVLSVGNAFADDVSRKQLAADIVDLTTTGALVDQMAGAIWPTLEASILAKNENVSDEALAAMKSEYIELNRGLIVSLTGTVTEFYAENYTEDELKELMDFYRSPVGKKTLEITPKLMGEIFPGMMAKIQQDIPVMMEKFKKLAKEKGIIVG